MGIKYLHIETYKGLVDKRLDDLGDVNILVGDNNTCKTTFLEAINLVQSKNKEKTTYDIAIKRQGGVSGLNLVYMLIESLISMFNVNNEKELVSINTSEDDFKMRRVYGSISGLRDDCFTATINDNESIDIQGGRIYNSEESENEPKQISESKFLYTSSHYNNMNIDSDFSDILLDKKESVLELIKSFDETIVDIAYGVSKHSKLSVLKLRNIDNQWLSISSYGDGIKKVILLANTILVLEKGGILLIDEIETSLHYSALEEVYSWLIKICKQRNIQLFVTTHSREALKVLTNQDENIDVDVVVYKLENFEGDIFVERVGNNTAKRILGKGGDLR